VQDAVALVESWLALPVVVIPAPTPRHWSVLNELAVAGQARGPLVMDAHLAAPAVEHGAVVCTTDRDFARFPGVRVSNPI
jgi:predicted nucleic acid-binding protein